MQMGNDPKRDVALNARQIAARHLKVLQRRIAYLDRQITAEHRTGTHPASSAFKLAELQALLWAVGQIPPAQPEPEAVAPPAKPVAQKPPVKTRPKPRVLPPPSHLTTEGMAETLRKRFARAGGDR